jgi:hypothetical protein
MKTIITLGTALLLAKVSITLAAEPLSAKPASTEFERMKSLIGT